MCRAWHALANGQVAASLSELWSPRVIAIDLGEGDMYVVPKGVRHNPVAEHVVRRRLCFQVCLQSFERIQHRGGSQTQRHISQHNQEDPPYEPRLYLCQLRIEFRAEPLHIRLLLLDVRVEFP